MALTITWVDLAPNEVGYAVERTYDHVFWDLVGELPANSTSFLDTDTLLAGTEYYYRVTTICTNCSSYGAISDPYRTPANIVTDYDTLSITTYDSTVTTIQNVVSDYETMSITTYDTYIGPNYEAGLAVWDDFERREPLYVNHDPTAGDALTDVDLVFLQSNIVFSHTDHVLSERSASLSWGTTGADPWYNFYAKSTNAAYFPAGGDGPTFWKFQPSPVATTFVPNSDQPGGTTSFHIAMWVWHHPSDATYDLDYVWEQTYFAVGDVGDDGWAFTRSSDTDPGGVNKLKFSIRKPGGPTDDFFHSQTIDKRTWYLVQAYYNDITDEVGLRVNDGAWEVASAPNPPLEPTMGAAFQAQFGPGQTQTLGFAGKIGQFVFYSKLLKDHESIGMYNEGRGRYWNTSTGKTEAIPAPTYTPAARKFVEGPAILGDKQQYYVCPTTVNSSRFSLVTRLLVPQRPTTGGGQEADQYIIFNRGLGGYLDFKYDLVRLTSYIIASGDRSNGTIADTYDLTESALIDFVNNGSGNELDERRFAWNSIAFCWDGPTATMGLYVHIPTIGWTRADGGTTPGVQGSVDLLNTNTTFGGHDWVCGETWLSYVGFDDSFIDFSVPANRDLFFDPLTGLAVSPDTVTWTQWGGQPLVWAEDADLANHDGRMAQWTHGGVEPALASTHSAERYE